MGTTAYLGVTRRELVEPVFGYSREARDIDLPQGGRNRVIRWPGTHTITLAPINTTTSFSEGNDWEDLKFRLSDCNYNPAYWREVPECTRAGVGPCDYFFNLVVNRTLVPVDLNADLCDSLIDVSSQAIFDTLYLQNNVSEVQLLTSKVSYPQNQGYCLRFRVEGRGSFNRARLFRFFFADYSLVLNSNGMAEVWQTFNFHNYGLMHTFNWSEPSSVHDNWHRIIIFPHARNKIEFISQLQVLPFQNPVAITHGGIGPGLTVTEKHSSVYEVPGELVFNNAVGFVVTKSGYWGLVASREFRPYIQISRLGFDNGTDHKAGFYDAPFAFEAPPTVQPMLMVYGDVPAGRGISSFANYRLIDPVTQSNFIANGIKEQAQFYISMMGIGNVNTPTRIGAGTTVTPEFYGYAVDKAAVFETIFDNLTIAWPISTSIDRGDSPDAERLNVHLKNDTGELSDFERRADIPLQIVDTTTGLTLFEGTADINRSSQSPAQSPTFIELEARGMADTMQRKRWLRITRNNFGRDPNDSYGRAWVISDVIRRVFESGGFDPATQVVIEDENVYLKPPGNPDKWFRLWLDGGSGGTRTGSSGVGDGHNQRNFNRWWPQTGSPVYEFQDYIIRGVLGWNWMWDLSDHKWHVYKRPRPKQLLSLPIAARFWRNIQSARAAHLNDPTVPDYTHRSLGLETERPRCTTVTGAAIMMISKIETKTDLANLIANLKTDPNPEDPQLPMGPRLVEKTLENPNGYASPRHPNPDTTSPDYMRKRRELWVPLMQCATKDSFEWMLRRIYEDNAYGYVFANFNADWGDQFTYNLRKWRRIQIDTAPDGSLQDWLIDRVEPDWSRDANRRARYRASLMRAPTEIDPLGAPPPR